MTRTIEEITHKVEYEGLGYCILDYYGRDLNSEDPNLNSDWAHAYDTMRIIQMYFPSEKE